VSLVPPRALRASSFTDTGNGGAEMPTIELRGIAKRFGRTPAVDGLSMVIEEGFLVTLLGPSGCGKSTTLNIIAGLEKPDAGHVLLGGQDITAKPPNERDMGMVFQNYALYPQMTVFQNLSFGLRLRHTPDPEIRDRVSDVAKLLGIESLLLRRPAQLSGGQQQRVALGRALVRKPSALLLDEPLSNLDAGLRVRMRAVIKKLHMQTGATSVFVTHDQEEAMTVSDRIAVMDAGRIVQFGTPDEVYARPGCLFVATFVGKPSMNIIPAQVDMVDGCPVIALPEADSVVPAPPDMTGPRRSVLVGVRPEHVELVLSPSAAEGLLSGLATLLEPVGPDTYAEITVAGHSMVARVSPDSAPALGQRVGVRLPPDKLHFFSPDDGSRLN